MAETRKQKTRTRFASMLEHWFPKNQTSKELRAANRRVEKRKRAQFRRKKD